MVGGTCEWGAVCICCIGTIACIAKALKALKVGMFDKRACMARSHPIGLNKLDIQNFWG